MGLLVIGTGAATAVGAPGRDGDAAQPAPPSADGDRDKVFDDLERRLSAEGRDAPVGVIVTLRAPATADRAERVADAAGDVEVERRFSIVPAFAGEATKGEVRELAQRPEVARVEENRTIRALNDTAQASFGVTKARLDAGVDGDQAGGPGTYSKDDSVAAVVDTGIDPAHPDLDDGKVLASVNCLLPGCPAGGEDDEGHGTHVAGILAGDGEGDARYRGVAPGAGLVSVKVLDAAGTGTVAGLIAGIEWAVSNKSTYGIEAINLSLGEDFCSDGTEVDSVAVNNAFAAGLVVSVAAGNDGPDACTIGAPGAAAGALTVGSMTDLGAPGETPAGFYLVYSSSRGPTADDRVKPDVVAPGASITSANGAPATKALQPYRTISGTSMATPFVAGVALLMLDKNSALTPQQVKTTIRQTALDWGRSGDTLTAGSTGPDIDYGAGRLDAYGAIEAAAGADVGEPPPLPGHLLREGNTTTAVEYDLQVNDTSFPIAATLIVPGWDGELTDPDYDLELEAPNGTTVASSSRIAGPTSSGRQEQLGFRPTATGTYKLRIVSFGGAGDFFVDISGGIAGAGPGTPAGAGAGSGNETVRPPGGTTTGGSGGSTPAPPTSSRPAAPAGDTRPARLRLGDPARASSVLRTRGLSFLFRSSEAIRGTFSATISVPGTPRRLRVRAVTRSVPANRRVTINLRLSRRQLTAIARALRARRRVAARVRVSAADRAGNRSRASRLIRIRR